MYPLNVVLVGCPDDLVPELLGELFHLNARVTARYPDVGAAVTRPSSVIAWTDGAVRPTQTQLFVVYLRSREDARGLAFLGQTFPGSPVVALTDPAADDAVPSLALGQGAEAAVPVPLPPGEFRAALAEAAKPFARPAGPPKVIAVAGAAGGVGTTTLAVNLACELAAAGVGRVMLVELTHRMGVVADFLNVTPQTTTRDLASEGDRLDAYRVERALAPAGENLAVLAAPPAAPGRRPAPVKELLRVVELARALDGVAVVDVPCTHDDLYYGALGTADRAVVVGEQRVPTVRAWQVVLKAVAAQNPTRAPVRVVNRFDPRMEGFGLQELSRVLGKAMPYPVADDPRAVADAINRGLPVRQQAPVSPVVADVAALAQALLGAGDRPAAAVPPPGSSVTSGSSVFRVFQAFRRATG